ncbi:ABC transporter ATP-binding protein [Clostridium sp. LP20]|uniref:ABC transporter ATP-binding protein n=1 Tax=Clostridium sp. LP20 TaxID=3418665 RepID=UPI003EE715E6
MNNVIEVVDLCKSYILDGNNETKVLKKINLTVKEGDFLSIMGPSGSGKSTLLYLLGGLDKPSSGKINIDGKDIAIMNDKEESIMRRREIGFIFQFYNLVPNLTVEENIILPLMLDGKSISSCKNSLEEILEIVGLIERRKHKPRQLSGGQQQRVAIARALISNPKVILADEPIGNLDSKMGEEIMILLRKINEEQGRTIVQVTHSTKSSEYGNRVVSMQDGVISEMKI